MADLLGCVGNWCAMVGAGQEGKVHAEIDQNKEALGRMKPKQLDQAMEACNPHHHGIVYLALLAAKAGENSGLKAPEAKFIEQCTEYFMTCKPEHARDTIKQNLLGVVCTSFFQHVDKSSRHIQAVRPLKAMLSKMQPEDKEAPPQMTVVHKHFVCVCIKSKCYKEALPVLEEQVLDLPREPRKAGLDPYDLVVTFYYSALAYIGLKQYTKALNYLKLAFTVSINGPTACLVEAYKKYVLLSLITSGTVPSLPSWVGRIQNQVESRAKAYTALKEAYGTHSMTALSEVIAKHTDEYTNAKSFNMGLVAQVAQSLTRRNVQRLTQTYLTLSLADIADKTGLSSAAEAEKIMLSMIEEGDIFATINQRDGMVSFIEDPESYATAATVPLLHERICETFDLAERVRTLDAGIQQSPEFIKSKAARGGGALADADGTMDTMESETM